MGNEELAISPFLSVRSCGAVTFYDSLPANILSPTTKGRQQAFIGAFVIAPDAQQDDSFSLTPHPIQACNACSFPE